MHIKQLNIKSATADKNWLLVIFLALFCFSELLALNSPITTIKIHNTSQEAVSNDHVTFGLVFRKGHVPDNVEIGATSSDGSALPIQTDLKGTHADGSIRHAIFTLKLSAIEGNATQEIHLVATTPQAKTATFDLANVLASDYDVKTEITLDGQKYSATAKTGLEGLDNAADEWLNGALCREWQVVVPLTNEADQAHDHLTARYYIRAYGTKQIQTRLVIENNWTYVANPQGYTYDVKVTNAESEVLYQKEGLKHAHHSRWTTTFWYNKKSSLFVTYDIPYLLSTRALPNYDQSITIPESTLSEMSERFEPMSNGDFTSYMPMTGQHPDIGPLPKFAAEYLLSMDIRAAKNTLANGEAAGSYPMHFRDKDTDLPVSIDDYPYCAVGRIADTRNPSTGQLECPANDNTDGYFTVANGLADHTPDRAHQPSTSYLPYLISGDYFHLEELHFWATYNFLNMGVGTNYREHDSGLLGAIQIRGQAWSMRTLAQAAYITPDLHPMKDYFEEKLSNNIDRYTERYVGGEDENVLNILTPYDNELNLSPWQDNFFTWTLGYIYGLGYEGVDDLLQWKAKFPVSILSNPFCWLKASSYLLQYTDAGEWVKSFDQFATLNEADVDCDGTTMEGYPDSGTGYGAILQAALAEAVNAGIDGADLAWSQYEKRNPKQDFASKPTFAIVPYTIPKVTPIEVPLLSLQPSSSIELSLSPNPIIDDLSLRWTGNQQVNVAFQLFDLSGKKIYSNQLILEPGESRSIPLDATFTTSQILLYKVQLIGKNINKVFSGKLIRK